MLYTNNILKLLQLYNFYKYIDSLYKNIMSLIIFKNIFILLLYNSSCFIIASPKSVAWDPTNKSYFANISSLVNLPSASESDS